jgi:predicted nucleotidyltransferase
MVEKETAKKLRKFQIALKRKGIRVARMILYGSRAAGTFHKDSDIDVAVVSPDFGKDRFEEGVMLFRIACAIDPRIEPVPISVKSYEKDTWVPLIYEIRTKGVEVPIGR